MTTPTVVVVQPDLEAWVWANLKDLKGVTSFCFSAIPDRMAWQYSYEVQVDCRASRKKAAHDLAELARQRILALPAVAWSDGFITYVSVTNGPFWLPDDPDGTPRYSARYEIRCHPARPSTRSTDTANTGGQ
jgi:hypothetical protein